MDESNPQMQNPNVPPMTSPPTGEGQPMGPMPVMPQTPQSSSKKSGKKSFWILIAVIAAGGVFLWWYLGNMNYELPQVPQFGDGEVRQDAALNQEILEVDLGDLDAEFEAIDQEIDSL